jgi:hypothetical protein
MQTGIQLVNDTNESRRHFIEAAKYYLESAETFPQDDEKHACESDGSSVISFAQG